MNRLKDAISPYLRQHADNPVDWYMWGDDAFARARQDDKPILLSIGYSACHWCHVMAHESFEDPDTAAQMNRDFVNIKVDREERPDVDDIYMQATLIFNRGQGGWPMTVFLTPDGRPFHAGTYFPKDDRYGMPSFRRVLAAVAEAFQDRRKEVEALAAEVTEGLQRGELGLGRSEEPLNRDLLRGAWQTLVSNADRTFGGLSRGRPKFPSPMNSEALLMAYAFEGDADARETVAFSLRSMARGGIYDQIGGGFHRYSVDERWLVPHFEKMLYDNAQLSRLYVHAWQATGDSFFRTIAEQTYDYVLREMTSPEGGFYSATDADSEGEEGRFFIWTADEIKAALPEDDARAAIAYWGITVDGNFEGRNILFVPFEEADVAAGLDIDVETLRARLASAREKLYEVRARRAPPHTDDKVLTGWNGLMLASLAEGARLLNRPDYLRAAQRNADFLLSALKRDGRLLRSYKDGVSQYNAYLEDYGALADGLIELYQATFEPDYLRQAIALADVALARFPSGETGFYDTSDDHETLIARPRNVQDNAVPSGNALITRALLRLAAFTGDARYEAAALGVLRPLAGAIRQVPAAFGMSLGNAALLVYGIDELAIIGDAADEATRALLDEANGAFRPGLVLALGSEADAAAQGAFPPLLAGRKLVSGQPAAYVCRRFACQRPVTTPHELAALLRRGGERQP
ncbi:MAG: thioredoxin domain-containing protein [Anaerolineae bacterium]|nr:thioredoxin domain-containing protein [Anaerolineae bacterium]